MSLYDFFKNAVDEAPLDHMTKLDLRPTAYKDALNYVKSFRCGLTVEVDGHTTTLQLNLHDHTTIVKEIVKIRCQFIHAHISESELTESEVNAFKRKILEWLLP